MSHKESCPAHPNYYVWISKRTPYGIIDLGRGKCDCGENKDMPHGLERLVGKINNCALCGDKIDLETMGKDFTYFISRNNKRIWICGDCFSKPISDLMSIMNK